LLKYTAFFATIAEGVIVHTRTIIERTHKTFLVFDDEKEYFMGKSLNGKNSFCTCE